jgi:hypothetical protein
VSLIGQESKLSLTEETRSGVLRTFLLTFLAGIFVFLPLKLPMVAATSAWFCGFSRVLFTDLVKAKQIYQSNYLRLVTVEETTTLVYTGPRTFSGLDVILRGGYMSASQLHEGSILVADDNEANRELLSSLLGQEGYHIISVADGAGAAKQRFHRPRCFGRGDAAEHRLWR